MRMRGPNFRKRKKRKSGALVVEPAGAAAHHDALMCVPPGAKHRGESQVATTHGVDLIISLSLILALPCLSRMIAATSSALFVPDVLFVQGFSSSAHEGSRCCHRDSSLKGIFLRGMHEQISPQ